MNQVLHGESNDSNNNIMLRSIRSEKIDENRNRIKRQNFKQ